MSKVFSVADIQGLIEAFPPPEPRPAKVCLVRSRSGRNLVRSDAVTKRFQALLEKSQSPLLVSGLPGELGVQDVRWLLEDDSLVLFFTRDRQRIIPVLRQQEIGELLRSALQTQGVRLVTWAEQYDLSADTLRRMTSRDPTLDSITLDDGLDYSKARLDEVRSDILRLIRGSANKPVNVTSEAGNHLPATDLQRMCLEILSNDDNQIKGNFENKTDGFYFFPQSALSELQNQKEMAKKEYIDRALHAIKDQGYCSISIDQRAQLLQEVSPLSLGEAIEAVYQQSESHQSLIFLRPSSEGTDDSGNAMYLVREDTLSVKQEEIASSADQIADRLWGARVPGQDVVYYQDAFIEALIRDREDAGTTNVSFESVLMRSQYGSTAASAFESRITKLYESTVQQFSDHIRSKLLSQLQLYSKGVESILDPTLQTRVLEFVTDWARRTLTPEVLLHIKEQKLVANKAASRELDKFSEAVKDAKTLSEVVSASAKLARKLRIDQPDAVALTEAKRSILSGKVGWLKRVKRSSDLLQNLTWILLASNRDGLFTSSGKDTSRMIKLYQTEGGADVGKRLGELRDVIKAGKETDKEKAEMREMAKSALDSFISDDRTS